MSIISSELTRSKASQTRGGDNSPRMMMRRILVNAARARGSRKRGGGAERVTFDEVAVFSPEPEEPIPALDAAVL
jgi:hypothetical protein